jgi:hypothetical protein
MRFDRVNDLWNEWSLVFFCVPCFVETDIGFCGSIKDECFRQLRAVGKME